MPTPKAVQVIGTCDKCKESTEITLPKKVVKMLHKAFKIGYTRPPHLTKNDVTIPTKCVHCGSTVGLVLTKKDVKEMFHNMKLPEAIAQKHADSYLEKQLNAEMNKQCSLGSCDGNIFSEACDDKILGNQYQRYKTILHRETDTIGIQREKHLKEKL